MECVGVRKAVSDVIVDLRLWKAYYDRDDIFQAVAIARKYCSDPPPGQAEAFDLTCQPAFRDEGALEKPLLPSHSHCSHLSPTPTSSFTHAYAPTPMCGSGMRSLLLPSTWPSAASLTASPPPTEWSSRWAPTASPALWQVPWQLGCVRAVMSVSLPIGIDAVAIAIRAVCFARLYLQNDHLDINVSRSS
ncbi:hypothetical protein WJX84_003237 [Apatococcus fuscideae]|uniref:Uncharacterized protein n=1 Tax=Apatococcus fuscideae TaxID=2026836 RepID=A0AAW1SPC9_9CHLO